MINNYDMVKILDAILIFKISYWSNFTKSFVFFLQASQQHFFNVLMTFMKFCRLFLLVNHFVFLYFEHKTNGQNFSATGQKNMAPELKPQATEATSKW